MALQCFTLIKKIVARFLGAGSLLIRYADSRMK